MRIGTTVDGDTRYTPADIEVVRTALRLWSSGLPLGDLLALARDADAAMRGRSNAPVELFDEHVRKPIATPAGDDAAAAEQMVEAFRELLPAVTELVAHHFRRVLLETAEAQIGGMHAVTSADAPLPRGARRRPGPSARSSTRSPGATTW
ncbi:MAG: hypothetical protein U0V56_03990 [Actinomycetota bacterium]